MLGLTDKYEAFIRRDAQMPPIEIFGDLHEKDIIETVRISPFDAQAGWRRQGLR